MKIENAKIVSKTYWGTTRKNSSVHGEHLYHNCSQVLEFNINGDPHSIEYQSGNDLQVLEIPGGWERDRS